MIATRKISLLLLSMACAVWSASSVHGSAPDGPAAREVVAKAAQSAFQSADYASLEKTAEDFRKTKARFPEGVWMLPSFYDGLGPKYNGNKPDWKTWFDKLDAWKAAFPDSLTQPVARAAALVDYAWDARGGGYANTVTSEGWKLLAERLAQARGVLDEAAKPSVRDPEWYHVMQSVALGEGWDHERYETLFDKAVAAEPTYYHYYFSRVSAELPRWGGGPDAWIDFAEKATRKYDPDEGMTMYTRIVWSHSGAVGGSGIKNPRVDWKKMRQGFLDIEKKYPDSNWNLNNFCRFACLSGDRETAHGLFARLGDAVSIPTWGSRAAFDGWRHWADPSQGPSALRADLVVPSDEKLLVAAVAFSPDGKSLLAGYQDGELRLWDLETRKITWHEDLGHGQVAAIAFSPDGKTFAVGTGSDNVFDTPGVLTIFDAKTHAVLAKNEDRRGNVFALAFTPDGKTLAVVGGCFPGFGGQKPYGEAALYDLATKKIEPLPWGDLGSPLRSTAISPDGQSLVTTYGRSMNCWSLVKHEFVTDAHKRGVHPRYVEAVAISPDGKTFVTGTAPFWNDPTGSGTLRRWDMTAPNWPEIKTPVWPETPGGILAAVFSPNGKWLAAGGYDGSVHLWDTATGTVAATLTGHHEKIGALAFAPDGKTLASGAADGTVKWWTVPATANPPHDKAP